MTPIGAGCLEETTVLAFLGGTLLPDARSAVEEHIAACGACADLVTWAAADQTSSTMRMPGQEGRPFVGQLHPGARVGRYQILGAVGRGGMGEVYAAYHPDLDRRIALKVVQGLGGNTGERRARLLREARAIARLSHPNVVTVHDAGTFGDHVFIAMELIDGHTIDQWLRAGRRTWQEILDVFIAAGRGLAAAHAADVIHRDFKPQNVMIGRNGSVHVMDFGLAQLSLDDVDSTHDAGEDEPPAPIGTITKTGAFIGTPAYMSPEQFRREATDARSDQFSFCVALHEALFGTRPAAARAQTDATTAEAAAFSSRTSVPAWLRNVVLRGASADRDLRFRSMDELLLRLEQGRTRLRRRVSVVAVGFAALVVSAGALRLAHGNRFACEVPKERIAAAWAANETGDQRRQSIHRTFAASGRATAETSWERLSKVLDQYVNRWSAMYLQTCEATHARGEQSAEVLDLRMSCLNDNLEQVRALTDALMTAEVAVLSRAVAAAQDLTPVSRCADVALLRSTVPLPRQERTLREVLRLRRSLAEVQTLMDLGDAGNVRKRSNALRPEVEATGYKPLLAQLLTLLGNAEATLDDDPSQSEATLREAMIAAEASNDDLAAAKVAANLVFVVGHRLGRGREAEFWAGLGHAILDRIGGDQARVRGWVVSGLASAKIRTGDFEAARVLAEKSVLLKEQALGKEHPDVASGLGNLAYVLLAAGHPDEALVAADRAVEIFLEHSDPEAFSLAFVYANQGDALNALGRYADAEKAYANALKIHRKTVGAMNPELAFALHGLGATKLAQGAAVTAVPFFEDALRIRQQPHSDPLLAADTAFGLARALWISGGDRTKARSLAATALDAYREGRTTDRRSAVEAWLAAHRTVSSRSRTVR